MQDQNKFKEQLALVSEKYQVSISQAMTAMIWLFLQDYSDRDCIDAFTKVIINGRFYKDLIPDLKEALQGYIKEDPSTKAWLLIDNAMRKHGPYVSIDFGDKKIHKAIESLGGWEYLGTLSEDDWKWKRKEFDSIYEALSNDNQFYPDHVIGTFESKNILKFPNKEPEIIRIADKKQGLIPLPAI